MPSPCNNAAKRVFKEYLETNDWQLTRIKEGLAASREGQVLSADEVFVKISDKYSWSDNPYQPAP
jgi:predicted transcriptional regulator